MDLESLEPVQGTYIINEIQERFTFLHHLLNILFVGPQYDNPPTGLSTSCGCQHGRGTRQLVCGEATGCSNPGVLKL